MGCLCGLSGWAKQPSKSIQMKEKLLERGYNLTDTCNCGGGRTWNYDKSGNEYRFAIKTASFSVKKKNPVRRSWDTVDSGGLGVFEDKLNKYAPVN